MPEYIIDKETNTICDELRGWVAYGERYVVVRTIPIGSNDSEAIWGWEPVRWQLGDYERNHQWIHEEHGFFRELQNDKSIYIQVYFGQYYSNQLNYVNQGFLFCECGAGEIDCGECCILCCKAGQVVLDKLKGK